ncbi:MAG: hypothetical protein SGARI_004773, partial [Bacillariaceae sp.]
KSQTLANINRSATPTVDRSSRVFPVERRHRISSRERLGQTARCVRWCDVAKDVQYFGCVFCVCLPSPLDCCLFASMGFISNTTCVFLIDRSIGTPHHKKKDKSLRDSGGLFGKLFGGGGGSKEVAAAAAAEKKIMVKPRKAPIKVEPKVFFANERTFLAWMHISIILAGASIAILAFSGDSANMGKQIYGLLMLPVAIAFIVYAMYQCKQAVSALK